MNTTRCLSEQDLTLLYYGELAVTSEQNKHLNVCSECKTQFDLFRTEMDRLPTFAVDPGPAAETRMAARVVEQLNRPRRNWLPALGTSAAALVLLIGFFAWTPTEAPQQVAQISVPANTTTINLNEDMPDVNFLEDLELLQQLELLSQIEGV